MGFRSMIAALLLVACGPAGHGMSGNPLEALKGLPSHQDPPLALDDDDDLGRARHQYEALPVDDAQRSARRRELWAAYQMRIDAFLAADSRDDAFAVFETALGLWDPLELQDATVAAPDIDLAAPTAQTIYDRFAPTGGDLQAVTALLVLMVATPGDAARYQQLYADIAEYSDDLAISERGDGAKRLRPIQMLEEATAHFPVPWGCHVLIKLYLERQDAFNAAITQGNGEPEALAPHGESIFMPVYNIVRAYTRMGRLHEAPDVVDTLANQYGDEEGLRRALRTALADGSGGAAWATLAQLLLDERRGQVDYQLGGQVLEVGARRFPEAFEPKRFLGYLALRQGNVPVAIRWLVPAHQLAPKDHDTALTLAEAYRYQLADHLQAERLDAARADLKLIEEFHAAVKTSFEKPLESTLAQVYLTMGRGLYAQGEITDAAEYLQKVLALDKDPEALEYVGNIAMKRGDFRVAAATYAQASQLPRETPLAQLIDRARLRRMAGEAYASGGDTGTAKELWQAALDEWQQVLGAAISNGQRAEAMVERARILLDMGKDPEGTQSLLDAMNGGRRRESPPVNIYGDAIALLTSRGHYEEAADVYRQLLPISESTEYLKIYPSLWIVSLARIKGITLDPQAVDYLTSRAGTRWYHDLARFVTGQLTFEQLYARANTRGKRAEAFFYEGLAAYGRKDRATGDKYMKLVLQTEMFGFYEFDMAAYLLKHPLL